MGTPTLSIPAIYATFVLDLNVKQYERFNPYSLLICSHTNHLPSFPRIMGFDRGIWPFLWRSTTSQFLMKDIAKRGRECERSDCLCTPLCIQHNAAMGEKPGAEGVKPSFFHLSCSTRTRSKYFWSRKSYTFNSITQELCVNLGFNQLLALGLKHNLTPVQLPRSWDVSELLTLTHLLCSAALLCKVPLGVAWSDDAFARGYSVPH